MKLKRLVAMTMAGVLTAGMMAGCGSSGESAGSASGSADDSIKIAFIAKAATDQFQVGLKEGAESYAETKGVQLDYQAQEKETDVEKQIQMMENAIIAEYDAIILSAADSKSLNPTIVKANEAGIPVVLVNDTIDEENLESQGGHYETYVGIDQSVAAQSAAEYVVENYDGGKVALIEGAAGVLAGEQRLDGFKDTLTDDFEVIASQTANWDRNEAYSVMQNILTANPDTDIVWAVSSEMGQGALSAIEEAGKSGEIAVFDFDCLDDDIKAIEAGTLVGSVKQFPKEMSEAAVDACLAVLDGEALEPNTLVDTALITKDNLSDAQ